MFVNLGGIHAGMIFLDTINLSDSIFIQRARDAFVRSDIRHQGIQTADGIQGFPFFQGFVAVGCGRTIRKCQRRSSDALVISGSRGIRKKPLYNRSDKCEAELGHFCIMFKCFSVFTHGKSPPSYVFFIIRGEKACRHPTVVWSEDRNIRCKNSLMIPCACGACKGWIFMGLQKRMGQLTDK